MSRHMSALRRFIHSEMSMTKDRKFFGTDGIRGKANTAPMDAFSAQRAGMAAGAYFTMGEHRHRVVIGKDTRLSGYMIETALISGFTSVGMDVVIVGPMPTPAIAMLTRSLRADLGVMISASHNPYHDNGIKFFSPSGLKLSDDIEREIEELMAQCPDEILAAPDKLGRAKRLDDAPGRYIEHVKYTFPKRNRLDGVKIVLDCANGAAYKMAPTVLRELGAEVIALAVEPDGFNINRDCGSTHPKHICAKVIENEADIGIALDGDADRVVVCDEKGRLVDGDQILGAIATYWQEEGRLRGEGIVATVMSNMGLEEYLAKRDMTLIRTQVGDRYVSEVMREKEYNLGGEQSGHIIFNDYTTTGDGLIAALQVLAFLVQSGRRASEILDVFTPYPQILQNIRYPDGMSDIVEHARVQEAITRVEDGYGAHGRVLIRKSGTEPLIRVMTEHKDRKKAQAGAGEISSAIRDRIQPAAS